MNLDRALLVRRSCVPWSKHWNTHSSASLLPFFKGSGERCCIRVRWEAYRFDSVLCFTLRRPLYRKIASIKTCQILSTLARWRLDNKRWSETFALCDPIGCPNQIKGRGERLLFFSCAHPPHLELCAGHLVIANKETLPLHLVIVNLYFYQNGPRRLRRCFCCCRYQCGVYPCHAHL